MKSAQHNCKDYMSIASSLRIEEILSERAAIIHFRLQVTQYHAFTRDGETSCVKSIQAKQFDVLVVIHTISSRRSIAPSMAIIAWYNRFIAVKKINLNLKK